MIKILGIETSCDETSVAIVTENKEILVNLIHSQIEIHKPYGGVVPEIASRAHSELLPPMIKKALKDSNIDLNDIDAIAVTSGPGLIGGLITGIMTAKGMAHVTNKPLIGINHLEGHALTPRLTENLSFPYLLLLISGGHSQILIVKDVSSYELLGQSQDDALGEAFDKLAKMMQLDYPGGPIIEQIAKNGNENKFKIPKAMVGRKGCDFSFSGIKTFLRNLITENEINDSFKADLAASFQKTVCEIIKDRLKNAIYLYEQQYPNEKKLVISGGVAANNYIKSNLTNFVQDLGYELFYPPIKLCTDNAAMIAWAGIERFKKGFIDNLSLEPKPRWPLEELIQSSHPRPENGGLEKP